MGDLLVPLYRLRHEKSSEQQSWLIRKPLPPEKHIVVEWVKEHFSEKWASECDVACAQTPASCLIAVEDGKLLGFACYDVTCLNFFGPTGVHETARGEGIGHALLVESLKEMKHMGYAYAIIGGAGPVSFYKRAVGAIDIPGSDKGVYEGILQTKGELE
ncbi:GNAT family N-acetyltransferase [Pseudalkalibacillus decolorationis]|uniref:GNAT family N-acetyltransferase n=1 Tax=Pseudalkalibacillus decolorationis TaxID=163879 RepID=UPI002148E4D7|nr:GNAT family N-acetyltransferase [Pseudalkalibacillus decolorationis]